MQPTGPNIWISYGITAIAIAIVLAIRWKRMSKVRPLKLEHLWIFPALYAALATYMYVTHPPQGWAWAFCVVALLLGAALGWQRGKFMRITVDPATHTLNQSSSPAAILFIVALILARNAGRAALASGTGTAMLHLNAIAVTDMLIAFGLGLFAVQRLEMYLRGRRLLDEARRQRS
ncbi:DUF1453 family protein [Roseomonas aeriglobus]|nr:DUF1453 family protein [Roseomonas aeriglobus]